MAKCQDLVMTHEPNERIQELEFDQLSCPHKYKHKRSSYMMIMICKTMRSMNLTFQNSATKSSAAGIISMELRMIALNSKLLKFWLTTRDGTRRKV
ncbi:hypothetical protein Leryth_014765 [Lithospermum erythrorhizon]|nr:hypothetical protein Leryth_014765 [Lithospermum erythrorhizon]